MRPANHLQIVIMIKLLRNILSKGVPGTSRRNTPPASIIWVRPKDQSQLKRI